MVHTTSQLEHLQPIKLKILKIYQPPGNNNNNNSEKTKTKTSSPILSSSPLAAAKTTPSSSSSGVATSLVSSPAASSTKNKQFLIPPPNSLIAEVDAKSVKRNIFYQKTTNQQQLPISQPAYNNHHRKNAPHLQSSSFLVSPKSSTYSSEREPDGASAEDLPYRNETSSNRSTTNSKSSKQRSEAIIKARGAGAGIDSYEEIQLKNQNSVKKEASTAQRRLNLENNSRNSNLDGQAAKPSQKQQQQHENVLLKVERISDGKSGNLLLYGEALQDCSQLIGEDKCYVFNNLLQYHSSRKSQANNIQFMMAYPLRTSIVEIKNNSNSNSNSNSNDNRPAANAKTSEQKQKTEDLSSSHPTASSNNSNAGNQLSSSSRKNNKNNTRKFEDVVSSSHATTITQHHHHHHHWLVQQKTTTAQHKKQHRSSQHQHNALERQKMERKAEKITEHSLELARNTSTDAIENQQKRSSVKKSNNKHSHRTHHSIFYYSKPISPPSESPNLSSTKVSSPNSKTIQNHHSLRFHHSSSKPNSNSSSSRSKQPSASAALAKTMENESYSRSSSSIKKQSNSAYMTKIAIKNSSLGNSSVNTSTPTSETGSSNFSSSNNNNIMLNRDNVYQKPPVIPSNLLQNTFFKN